MLFVKDFPVAKEQHAIALSLDGEAVARFVSVMLAEIASSADAEQMRGFFIAVGKRLATAFPIGDAGEIDKLTHHGNIVWERLNWGQTRFELDDEGIDIFHEGMPQVLAGDVGGIWASVAPFILQGCYDGWFRQMGSGERLHTRISRKEGDRIELRHGV